MSTFLMLLFFSLSACQGFVQSATVPTLLLSHTSHNVEISRVLLGTGGGGGGFDATKWVQDAGQTGFDTAQTYCYSSTYPFCSQVAIANALTASHTPFSKAFIISKIEPEDFGGLDLIAGFGRVVTRGILQDMSTQYIDMLMFHQAGRFQTDSNPHPNCFDPAGATNGQGTYAKCRLQTWQAMTQLVKQGVAHSLAVSNWNQRDLEQLYNATGMYPSALEVEFHPFWHEDSLIDYCIEHNITVINYAPLAVSPTQGLLTHPAVVAVAQAHGVTPAQAALRWGLQRTRGVVIPRSANTTHMLENLDIFDFELSDAEMSSLSSLPQKKIFRTYCQPWC